MTRRRTLVASLACLLPLLAFSFFLNLSSLPIRVWDEARNANNAIEMYLHHHWLVPSYDGLPDMWNTKPPLLIWAQVAAMQVVGVGELAVRLPSAVAAAATAVLLWAFCAVHYGRPWTGFLAGAVMASFVTYVVIHTGRSGDYDAMLTFFLTAYSLSAFMYVKSGARKWIGLFWVCATLAALTKGVAGLLLFPPVALLVVVHRRVARIVREPANYAGALAFLLIVGGYYGLREHLNPGYWNAVVANEIVGRYVQGNVVGLGRTGQSIVFYLDGLRSERYWVWFLLPAYAAGMVSRAPEIRQLTVFNLIFVVSFWLVITGSRTQLPWYSLPLFPFFALQIGIALGTCWEHVAPRLGSGRLRRLAAPSLFALVFGVPFAQIAHYVFDTEEQGAARELHAQAWFLQHAVRHGDDLRNHVFLFRGYDAPARFYVTLLRSRGVNVEMKDSAGQLMPGDRAVMVASQADVLQQVENRYVVTRTGEQFGCVVDTVLDLARAGPGQRF